MFSWMKRKVLEWAEKQFSMPKGTLSKTGMLEEWILTKALEWLGGLIGINPEDMRRYLDIIVEFIKGIFGSFDNIGEAVKYMGKFNAKVKANTVSQDNRRKALEGVLNKL